MYLFYTYIILILIYILGDAIDKIEENVQNKLTDLDEIATSLEVEDDDQPECSPEKCNEKRAKRKLESNFNKAKKRKPTDNELGIQADDSDEPSTQDIADEIGSDTEESDETDQYEYDY